MLAVFTFSKVNGAKNCTLPFYYSLQVKLIEIDRYSLSLLTSNPDRIDRQSRRERAAFSCDSERKSASPACHIHLNHARKSVGNYGVFSLSFRSFLG